MSSNEKIDYLDKCGYSFECNKCNRLYKLKPKYLLHMKTCDPICSICGIQMSGTYAKNRHFPICKRRQVLGEHNYSLPPRYIDTRGRDFLCKGDYINAQELGTEDYLAGIYQGIYGNREVFKRNLKSLA